MADFRIERRFERLGFDVIIGVDEAGRGPLAGPLVAAAACLQSRHFKNRIDDSKRLSAREREDAFLEIVQKSEFALSLVDQREIDASNILSATCLSMEEAISSLLQKMGNKQICILVDGNVKLRELGCPVFNITKGDSKSKSIAAASILAKVVRDRIMCLYDKLWPRYGFLRHKGYPTSSHRLVLRQLGPCPIHRLSFSYV
jgi:ribonuclease HII